MSFLNKLFHRTKERPYQQQLNEKRTKLTAPVTKYAGRQHKKVMYFVNYAGFKDYSKNPRLIHKGRK